MPRLQRILSRPAGSLFIPGTTLASILTDGWATWPMETGGLLLGHRVDHHGLDAVAVRVIGPGPKARHERYGFEPDATWQAEQVATAWTQDNTLEYLGDWHTHPAGTTRFSPLDLAAAQTIAAAPLARQPHPIMVVAALQADLSSRIAAGVLVNGRLRDMAVMIDNGL
jgi:integrative and conjugative element protein (TIGR02256 family)